MRPPSVLIYNRMFSLAWTGLLAIAMLLLFTPPPPAFADGGPDGGNFHRSSASGKKTKKVTRAKKPRRAKKAKRKSRRKTARSATRRAQRQILQRPRQILVAFPASTSDETVTALAREFRLQRLAGSKIGLLGQLVVKFRTRRLSPALRRRLLADPRTARVQPNFIYRLLSSPSMGYAARALNLDKAHKIALGNGVKIAILDGGINAQHPAIAHTVSARFDALGGSNKPDTTHGTGIASIIAASDPVGGVAPRAALLSARVFGRELRKGPLQGETFNLLRGLDWAVRNKAEVINMSFAGPEDGLFHEALKAAAGMNVVLVAAAGNKGPRQPVAYPAAYEEVIAVTAVDTKNRLYRHASRGRQIAFAAPGVDIFVARKSRGYGLMSGTSPAAAFVSGSIALVIQKNPGISIAKIKDYLKASARDLGAGGRDRLYGYGLIDIYRALQPAKAGK
ncbi:MAG TPA: hypothetical protein ENJ99_02880 [Rhizobiales bacterium]|nr:hypothetical protein [Hyphomicrobiales bacterium]